MSKYDIQTLLKENNGLARVSNFFPKAVAEALREKVLSMPTKKWIRTTATRDHKYNNIAHEFYSIKHENCVALVARVLSLLAPEHFYTFSAAKYVYGHHIEPHDDRAYADVQMDTGGIVQCSRDIAVIIYLTKNWTKEDGGLLLDLEGHKEYVPEFNSCVFFRVPRMHAVTKVLGSEPRISIFGWFLMPGELYSLGEDVVQHKDDPRALQPAYEDEDDEEEEGVEKEEDREKVDGVVIKGKKRAREVFSSDKGREDGAKLKITQMDIASQACVLRAQHLKQMLRRRVRRHTWIVSQAAAAAAARAVRDAAAELWQQELVRSAAANGSLQLP